MHLVVRSVAEVIRTFSPKSYGRVVVAPPQPRDPVSIPHDVKNRGVGTGIDQELNPQVSRPLRVPPQVTESARLNLSRWRHGFKSRWDYEPELAGQGHSPEPAGSLNGDSNAEYPANIPRALERGECAKERARRGWMHSPTVTARTGADRAHKVFGSRRARSPPSGIMKVVRSWARAEPIDLGQTCSRGCRHLVARTP